METVIKEGRADEGIPNLHIKLFLFDHVAPSHLFPACTSVASASLLFLLRLGAVLANMALATLAAASATCYAGRADGGDGDEGRQRISEQRQQEVEEAV